jgi:hypothetical protein
VGLAARGTGAHQLERFGSRGPVVVAGAQVGVTLHDAPPFDRDLPLSAADMRPGYDGTIYHIEALRSADVKGVTRASCTVTA